MVYSVRLLQILLFASYFSWQAFSIAVNRAAPSLTRRWNGNGTQYSSGSYCCQQLAAILPDEVEYSGGLGYSTSSQEYWSAQERSVQPACYFLPNSAQDVATAVTTLVGSHCQFAVKSGGHMPQAGAANIPSGVTINLANLSQFSLDPATNYTTIGPGLRWGQVYTQLATYGLATPGGRSADVGVGGYLLGGGSSYFIPYGFGCDNVVAYEVVLANGSIITATASQYGDLFHALKGGSSNFGIVTAFTLTTFPLGGIWGGNIYYPGNSTYQQQLQAFQSFAGNPDYDTKAAVQMSISYAPSVGGVIFVDQPFYAAPEPYPAALQPFTNIQPQEGDETSLNTLPTFAADDATLSPDGNEQMVWAVSIYNDLPTLYDLYAAFEASIPAIANVSGIQWAVTLEPLPQVFLEAAATSNGGNVLGIPSNPPGNAIILCDSSFTWTNANDTQQVRAAGLQLLYNIENAARSRGTLNRWIDVNHADFTQNPIQSFGPSNYAFLQNVSAKYDPSAVFQRNVPGGFKISSSH